MTWHTKADIGCLTGSAFPPALGMRCPGAQMLLVGDSGVGKSCLLTRFTQDRFDDNQTSTIGVCESLRIPPLRTCVNLCEVLHSMCLQHP